MKKFILTLLLFLLPAAVSADAWNPFGSWICVMPGNSGEALVTIDPESHIFNIVMPQGDKFVCPFHIIIADGDKILIALLTRDRIAHPIELVNNPCLKAGAL